ncbi:MAG: glycosyltransferase [Thermoanaerobaculia bacterium]|nr:glycosyltransferase [Thermoanaerobaculia bacterium]
MIEPPEPDVLTIAIPTFDRNADLERSVRALLPQLRPGVRLIIRDNASPDPVSPSLAPLLGDRPDVTIVRNPFNIGGDANVLRCLETCQTEWLWILGDDDLPVPDALERILTEIHQAPETLLCVNYRSELFDRTAALELQGTEEFIFKMDSLSNILFLSSNIYRAPALKTQLRLAYTYSSTHMPHVVALLFALGSHGRIRLSTQQIAVWSEPELHRSWSVVNAALGFPTILDLPLSQRARIALARKAEGSAHPALLGLARQLLFLSSAEGDPAHARWLWRQIRYRRYGGLPLSFQKLLAFLLQGLFLAPGTVQPLVELAARLLLGGRASRNSLQDRSERI